MNGSALESKLLSATLGIDVACALSIIDSSSLLAGEVRSACVERSVAKGALSVRNGVGYFYMGVGEGGQARECDRFGEHCES